MPRVLLVITVLDPDLFFAEQTETLKLRCCSHRAESAGGNATRDTRQ